MAHEFKAWIVGKPLPPGVSAAAWQIKKPDGSVFKTDAKQSHGANSTGNRGVVAAAWGVLEDLPNGASVTVRSNLQYVVNGINGDAERWQKDRFRMNNGRRRTNADLWQKFLSERSAKDIVVRAEHIPKGSSPEDDAIYRELEGLAYDEADTKRAKLGNAPTGSK